MTQFITRKQLSERWGVSVVTLAYWQKKGFGAKCHMAGMRKVAYDMKDILAFEQENPYIKANAEQHNKE